MAWGSVVLALALALSRAGAAPLLGRTAWVASLGDSVEARPAVLAGAGNASDALVFVGARAPARCLVLSRARFSSTRCLGHR